jgi:GT2 family glycosyltransferase
VEVTSPYPKERVDIAIVTVSSNRLDEACLASVRRLIDTTPLRVKFILVDNASTEIDAQALTKKILPEAIVILRDTNVGFGRSCNRGAKEVDADYYFFLNPDTRVDDPEMLVMLYRFLKSYPQVGIAAPKILYLDGHLQETCRRFPSWFTPIAQRTDLMKQKIVDEHRRGFLMEDFSHEKRRMVDWVQGSAFMIDGPLFHDIGGFDDRYFMYYEDVDLCRTCWNLGRPVYYLPEAVLYHAYGKASAEGKSTLDRVLHNRTTRIHILSWMKYTLKYVGQKM